MLNSSIQRNQIFNRKPRQGDLNAGELVINTVDGTAWTKLSNNNVVPLAVLPQHLDCGSF